MPYSEAQKKATMKYLKEKTDHISLTVPKGTKERWQKAADLDGKSLSKYIIESIERRLNND